MNKKLITTVVVLLIAILGLGAWIVMDRPLELVGDSTVYVELGADYTDDGCTLSSADMSSDVDTSTEGEYTVTYTKGNDTVSRTVIVSDSSHVTVGLKGSQHTLVKEGEEYVESGAFGIDDRTGPITDYKTKGNVDTSTPGTYEIKYTFTDGGSIEKTVTRQVEVVAASEFEADEDGIPVMMYHYVYSEDDKPDTINANFILDTDLAEELQYLKDNDYYFPSFTELRAYVDGKLTLPDKSIILTFDDGQKNFLKHGIPVLEEYEVPATAFMIGSSKAEEKVKEYASEYVQFQSHSNNMHQPGGTVGRGGIISAMTKDQIVADLQESFKQVGNTEAFAYPYGDNTETAHQAMEEAGISCAFTIVYNKVHVGDNPYALPRVRVSGQNSLNYYVTSIK